MNADDLFGKIYQVVENQDYKAIDGMTPKERDMLDVIAAFNLYAEIKNSQKNKTRNFVEQLEKELGVSITE